MRAVSLMIVVLLVTSAGRVVVNAQNAGGQKRTVWDGVYTDAQAARATATFDSICTQCHTLAPGGNTRGGAVSGDKFWATFTQKSVGDLLTYVATNMPNGNGGSLAASTYNDLVALILKTNGFPTGTAEVTPASVADVQIIPKDGPGELPANTLVRVVGCLTKSGGDWVLTKMTTPERNEKAGPGPADATRPLGTGSMTLKFVLTRLDPFVGQRMSVSGMLIGAGGADGLNVTTVNRVAEICP